MPIALRYAARSDRGLGPKSRNEDSGYAGPHLLVLADGMGGHAAGDVASSMIVGELAPLDDEVPPADQAIAELEEALRRANEKLATAMNENADLVGMGSTTIALLRTGNKVALAHIGDSRAFLLRGDRFSRLTKDHSFVQQLVDEGRLSPDEAAHHPHRSVVTRVMTGQPDDEPDTSLREARVGDRFLLCSDGLSDFVGAEVIEEVLRKARSPEDAADRCIDVALKASTRDNVTVIVADVVDARGDDLPATVPQVVGAAAKRMRDVTRPIPTSPAAKAAALTREATRDASRDEGHPGGPDAEEDHDGVKLAEDGPRNPRRRTIGRIIGGVVVVALLVGGAWAAYAWSQRQYYVAASDAGKVTIFRGVSDDLGPIQLSHVQTESEINVSDLPTDWQSSLAGSIPADDLAHAHTKVAQLRAEARRCRALAASGVPCGSTPVTPLPTVPGTGTVGSGGTPATGPSTPSRPTPTPRQTALTIWTPPPMPVLP